MCSCHLYHLGYLCENHRCPECNGWKPAAEDVCWRCDPFDRTQASAVAKGSTE